MNEKFNSMINSDNPTIKGYDVDFISFRQNKYSLEDIEHYRKFIKAAVKLVRRSDSYKAYKSELMGKYGINMCQYHGNIRNNDDIDMATIEMHHHILTIFDIAFIICEHTINTGGTITTFELAKKIEEEHMQHRVATVMLCKTCHQLQHNDHRFFIPTSMVFGDWVGFLNKYKAGVSKEIFLKIYYMLRKEIEFKQKNNQDYTKLIELADCLKEWSELNAKFYGEIGEII